MSEQQTVNNAGAQVVVPESIASPGKLVMRRFLRNKLAIVGLVILLVIIVFAYLGPIFSPYGEYEIFYGKNGEELINATSAQLSEAGVSTFARQQPSLRHPLGTDRNGQDMLTRLMYGGRISLMMGIVCIAIELALGMVLGGIAGYYGRWVDNLIMRIVDIFYCIPTLPIVMILSSYFTAIKVPSAHRMYYLMLVIGILGSFGIARLVRGQILSLREQEYMLATEATGLRPSRRIFKHLLPNVMPQLIVSATLGVGSVILFESALSFLGLGVPFPYASWGNIVEAVNDTMIMRHNLNIWVPPGVCIFLTVMAINFVGDGLRDAFDPKMKR